jgi:hypothetical protein
MRRKKESERSSALIAPAPIADRAPIVIGQNLTLSYLASTYRLATQGIRYPFVAGARLDIQPAKLPAGHRETARALEICGEVDRQVRRIPRLAQSLGALAWGNVFGISAAEIEWERTERWTAKRLHFIHSRRLSYPDATSWDLHVFDQGASSVMAPARPGAKAAMGLRIADYPGKFVVHTPQLSGDYPTRDGEGRYIGVYLALKRTIVRASAQDFERTIRPWVLGYFNRESDKNARTVADKDDIRQLEATVRALGLGSLNGAILPDACKVEILRAASTANAQEFVAFLDGQVTKAMLGQTFTTEPGKFGAKGVTETAKKGSLELARYDGRCLADSLEAGLVHWIVRLNFPGEEHLAPDLALAVDEEPDPELLMRLAKDADAIGVPLDYVELGRRLRLPLEDGKKKRRTKRSAPPRRGDDEAKAAA